MLEKFKNIILIKEILSITFDLKYIFFLSHHVDRRTCKREKKKILKLPELSQAMGWTWGILLLNLWFHLLIASEFP